jgi:hypothetical protein
MAIIATGGYGRGLLAPGSDIDLLFLLPYKQTPWGESVAEYLLYILWDLGFKVGHATRTVDQSIKLADADTTIRTSLIDMRLIDGDGQLYAYDANASPIARCHPDAGETTPVGEAVAHDESDHVVRQVRARRIPPDHGPHGIPYDQDRLRCHGHVVVSQRQGAGRIATRWWRYDVTCRAHVASERTRDRGGDGRRLGGVVRPGRKGGDVPEPAVGGREHDGRDRGCHQQLDKCEPALAAPSGPRTRRGSSDSDHAGAPNAVNRRCPTAGAVSADRVRLTVRAVP